MRKPGSLGISKRRTDSSTVCKIGSIKMNEEQRWKKKKENQCYENAQITKKVRAAQYVDLFVACISISLEMEFFCSNE